MCVGVFNKRAFGIKLRCRHTSAFIDVSDGVDRLIRHFRDMLAIAKPPIVLVLQLPLILENGLVVTSS